MRQVLNTFPQLSLTTPRPPAELPLPQSCCCSSLHTGNSASMASLPLTGLQSLLREAVPVYCSHHSLSLIWFRFSSQPLACPLIALHVSLLLPNCLPPPWGRIGRWKETLSLHKCILLTNSLQMRSLKTESFTTAQGQQLWSERASIWPGRTSSPHSGQPSCALQDSNSCHLGWRLIPSPDDVLTWEDHSVARRRAKMRAVSLTLCLGQV